MPEGAPAGQGRQMLPLQGQQQTQGHKEARDCLQISLAVCMEQGVPW